jgi:uncharacterized membrane protein YheB (UPF0754 family)
MGAIIGYVTNAIAIKMLFRPLKEVRLWGIRLPFTPGILPKERHKLAENIGSMVERELFTPEILRKRLQSEDVASALQKSVADYTKNLLDGKIDCLRGVHTPPLGAFQEGMYPETNSLPKTTYPVACGGVVDSAEKLLSLGSKFLTDFLMKEEIHQEMEVHGKIFLSNAILKLNVFQRFFISAGQYDKTLQEKMPEIIDDLIKQLAALLKDEHTKKRLIIFFQSMSAEQKEKIDNFISNKILSIADEKIESLLASIDVKKMVSERIDALDMLRVERIVLDVMDNQLKWINVFGAILGGFIGLFQAVFSRLLM